MPASIRGGSILRVRQFPLFVEIIGYQDFALNLLVYRLAELKNRIVAEAREERGVGGCHLVPVEGMPAIQHDVASGIKRIGINHGYDMPGWIVRLAGKRDLSRIPAQRQVRERTGDDLVVLRIAEHDQVMV